MIDLLQCTDLSVAISVPSCPFLGSLFENSDSVELNINSIQVVLSFWGFKVGAVVEDGESSARVWPLGTLC